MTHKWSSKKTDTHVVLSVAKNFIGHLNESVGREPTQFVAQ
jgi:hypothetical protein